MASVTGFRLPHFLELNSHSRPQYRFRVHNSAGTGGDPAVLSSDLTVVNGDSNSGVRKRKLQINHGNGRLKPEVEDKKKNNKLVKDDVEESLEPSWDDGYGTETVKDYFDAVEDMIKPDGGPPRWFSPISCGCPLKDAPILLFLPGMDGTGMGLTLHHKALGKFFEVRCLHIPVYDRTPFEELVKFVEETVRLEHASSPKKPIYLVGDSFGGCLSLAVASRNRSIDLVLILVNPATSFGRSQLQPFFPILEAMPDALHPTVPYLLGYIMGDPTKMAMVNVETKLPPIQRYEKMSQNLTALLPYLGSLADIIPRDTLLWKLKLLKSAAAYANSRLHAVKAEVLILASGKDNMVPSKEEAERLKKSLLNCTVRHFKENGHTFLLEDGISLMTIIKGTSKYRRSWRHNFVSDFLPPSRTEIDYAFEQVVGLLRIGTSSLAYSTLEDGKIVKGLAGVPSEGPVLLVGYHNLMGLELYPLVEEFLREKNVVIRGVAHPQLFVADSGSSSPEFSMNDWFRVFGSVPVTPSNLFRLLSSKSHVLLYPGGAREALHCKEKKMAPQVTVYFYKLPTTSSAQGGKKSRFLATFSIDRAPISCRVPEPIKNVKTPTPAKKAGRGKCVKSITKTAQALRGKAAKGFKKRQARAVKRSATKVAKTEGRPTKIGSPVMIQEWERILIGSVPIFLPTTVSVMVTSAEETETTPTSQPRRGRKATKGRKGTNTSPSPNPLEMRELVGGTPIRPPIVISVNRRGQQGVPAEINERPLLDEGCRTPFSFPKKARSDSVRVPKASPNAFRREHGDWMFLQGYRPTRVTSTAKLTSYTGPVTRSKARAMQESVNPSFQKVQEEGCTSGHSLEDTPHIEHSEGMSADLITQFEALTIGNDKNMPVLVTGTISNEEKIQELQRLLAERDEEVARLSTELSHQVNMRQKESEIGQQSSSSVPPVGNTQPPPQGVQPPLAGVQPQQDLKALIMEGIREYQAATMPILGYHKPYPAYYDQIPFPPNYIRQKFEKFDGINGSPHEHLAYFTSACGESAQSDALLIRQFVQSLKEAAFTWYTQLPAGSITTWDDMQKAFLAQFVSSKKTISLHDLVETKQRISESANEFITRWRNLNLQCPERISEQAAVSMCAKNLNPEVATFVGTAEPKTFNELVSKACNVEIQISRQRGGKPSPRFENKKPFKKGESMATFVNTGNKDKGKAREPQKKLTLKERKEVKYSFDDDDVDQIFDELLKARAIRLPEPKRPNEVGMTNDPNYCRYHQIVSHPLSDCYILKNIIEGMIKRKEIEIDSSLGKATTNTTSLIENDQIPNDPTQRDIISVAFEVDKKVTIVQAHSDMPRQGNPNIPTLYELMTEPNLEIWEDWYDSEEDLESTWQTCTRKKLAKIPSRKPSGSSGVKFRSRPDIKDQKGKKRIGKQKVVSKRNELEQPKRNLVTLEEFLPKELRDKAASCNDSVSDCCMTLTKEDPESTSPESEKEVDEITLQDMRRKIFAKKEKEAKELEKAKQDLQKPSSSANQESTNDNRRCKNTGEDEMTRAKYDILAHLKRIPALLSVYDALQMSPEHRNALVVALTSPEFYTEKIEPMKPISLETHTSCMACITFDDKDRQLGAALHNRPLYVTGMVADNRVSRIMLDCGSAVNVLPLKTLRDVGLHPRQLSPSSLTIQGFNQAGEKVRGSIILKIEIGELNSEALFHVIDSDTSYNVLLGRPWLHEYEVIPSTLHQCFKFCKEGKVKSVNADPNPFYGEQVNYADAKFYKPANVTILKGKPEESKHHENSVIQNSPQIKRLSLVKSPQSKEENLKVSNQKRTFKYIPKSQRGVGQKALTPIEDSMTALMTSFTLPLRKIDQSLPKGKMQISVSFGKNSKKNKRVITLNKASSTSVTPKTFKTTKKNVHFKKQKGVTIHQNSDCLKASFEPDELTEEEQKMFHSDDVPTPSSRVSVFDRLEPSTSTPRVSAFERLVFPSAPQSKGTKKQKQWMPKQKKSLRITIRGHETQEDGENFAQVNYLSFEESLTVEDEGSSSNPSEDFIDIFQPAPQEFEEGGQATVDDLVEINLGTEDDPKPVFVSALLSEEELPQYIQVLRENKDVFAWLYRDMPGLNRKVAVHRLAVSKDAIPVKQSQRRIRPELLPKVEAEIDKLRDCRFIREVQYPTWLANIVIVMKKNGQLRICVDYRDLNRACPKDEFPLPITELLIDATTGFDALSFMDGFSGYNQIKMAHEDEELTAFRTPKGIFCYTVMPFGLKNAGATYQRAMTTIFEDMMHNTVECYVDDLVVKTKERTNHLDDLKRVFDRLRQHNLKMNPLKCAFGVTSGKFLGFIVRHRGIEIDPAKIKAILEMPPPRNLRQLRGLQGKLAYIRRFISNLSGRCQPFSRLMQKNVPFIWDEACQNAFENIKKYLLHPPVLRAPILGKPLILYITSLDRSLGAMLAQNNEEGKEVALYYLSRTLVGAEQNYPPIEKVCLALIFAVTKLRHYLLSHPVTLVSKADPLRYILSKPVLSGRLAKWSMMLSEFEINFVPQKAIKGQALADFLAAHPIPDDMELREDLPDEEVFAVDTSSWQLYFDGAARSSGAGAGIVFVTPSGGLIPYSFHILAICTNNVAEYEALVIGLEVALEMKIQSLEVFGDSLLVIKQMSGEFAVKHENLVPYHEKAKYLLGQFQDITLNHIPRSKNGKADALANLAASLTLPEERDLQITIGERHVLSQSMERVEEGNTVNLITFLDSANENDWRQPIKDYIQKGVLPEDLKKRVDVRRRAPRFVVFNDTLYKRSFDGILLRCLSIEEAAHALQETHAGTCGAHQAGPKLSAQLKRLGYYWPTMVQDAINFAKCCKSCQLHGDFIHQPPQPLHPSILSWPFETWGMDVIGPFTPPSSKAHKYILAITDYFSKWAEAVPLKEVRAEDVADFIRTHVIYRYGVPSKIISDNALYFKCKAMVKLMNKYKFKHSFSASYNPSSNGQAEAFNKVLCKIMKKTATKNKRDWHERLLEALWAYRTTVRTATGCTPYNLVFGSEAVLPLEVQIPSLRIATQLTNPDENVQVRLAELEALDEKRLAIQQKLEIYQAQVAGAFNKKVKFRSFSVGDLVLTVKRPIVITRRMKGKFEAKWEGPYVVTKVFLRGAYELSNSEGQRVYPCVNGKFIKKFYT